MIFLVIWFALVVVCIGASWALLALLATLGKQYFGATPFQLVGTEILLGALIILIAGFAITFAYNYIELRNR